jgi:hypothetical protein
MLRDAFGLEVRLNDAGPGSVRPARSEGSARPDQQPAG